MTLTEYKTKLNELHDLIKENPFRRGYEANVNYGKGYYKLVYDLADTFYHLIKDIRTNTIEVSNEFDERLGIIDTLLFIHDFYASCNNSANAFYLWEQTGEQKWLDVIHGREEHLEACISCVHTYLETGLVLRYPFRYRKQTCWAEWNDEKNDYIVNLNELKKGEMVL